MAAPGKERFTEEELSLLEAVAYQIGTAVQKNRLIQAQRKRAEQYLGLDEASRALWAEQGTRALRERAVREAARLFHTSYAAMWVKKGTGEGRLGGYILSPGWSRTGPSHFR